MRGGVKNKCSSQRTAIDVKLVPYYAWGNRGRSEMSVWLPLGG